MALGLCLAAQACTDAPPAPTPADTGPAALAVIGEIRLTQADLTHWQQRHRQTDDRAALDALCDQARWAQAARADGLHREPTLRAAWVAAERETLARAYRERQLIAATTESRVRQAYAEQKEALAQREIHVQQIVVRRQAGDPHGALARNRANTIYARLKAGEAFSTLAQTLSEDPASAARGGDLGRVRQGQIDPGFFKIAVALGVGEIAPPFETEYGFHIIEALEAPRTLTPTLDEARGKLVASLRAQAQKSLGAALRARFPGRAAAPSQDAQRKKVR